jgi:predicted HTH transcriptional regulator
MNEHEVMELLARGKRDDLEILADASDFNYILQTACAMASTKGGHIVIGATERVNPTDDSQPYRLAGIARARGLTRRLESIGSEMRPPIKTEYDECKIVDGQSVFVVSVPKLHGDGNLSLKDGTTWKRRRGENVPGHIFKPITARETNLAEQQQIIKRLLETSDEHPKAAWMKRLRESCCRRRWP